MLDAVLSDVWVRGNPARGGVFSMWMSALFLPLFMIVSASPQSDGAFVLIVACLFCYYRHYCFRSPDYWGVVGPWMLDKMIEVGEMVKR